jgi:BirA family biotin operon repressor/biotin-[acetyl-CoA-carboxylase] ligase
MQLPLSAEQVPELIVLDTAGSTNTELARRAAGGGLAPFTTLVTADQTAGRGRLDRVWSAPPGTSLAVSVLVLADTPSFQARAFGWVTIAAGLAMADAVAGVIPGDRRVGLKWPNDVQIDGLKVCGILAELLPDATGLVVGAGVNVAMTPDQLPVPTATSVAIAGGAPGVDDILLSSYLREFRRLVSDYRDAGADAQASGLLARARQRCTTLGQQVRVDLPGGAELRGTAVDLDDSGRLVVEDSAQRVRAVAAGDVTHVR